MLIATVLIIPSFVVTGIYSYNRMNQADNAIAKVGEVSITPEQFDYAKRGQLERLRQTLGENFRANMLESPEAREDILRALIDDAALMQTAAAEYVAVSEAEAIAFIKSAAGLQKVPDSEGDRAADARHPDGSPLRAHDDFPRNGSFG